MADEPPQDIVPPVGENPEARLSDFLNGELSDITIKNPDNEGTKPCHKVVLASGSQYFLSLFRKDRAEDAKFLEPLLKGLDVPRPVKTAQNPSGACSDEVINMILKFFYFDQDFSVIKGAINDSNVLQIYSQAYMLQCPNLLKLLDEMVVNELVDPTNATVFYVDAILFNATAIFEACETIIQFNIENIIDDEKASEFLMNLPFERMHSLCKDDKLHVKNEGQLLKLIDRYLEVRNENKNLPVLESDIDPIIGAKMHDKKDWKALVESGVLTPEEADKKAQEAEAAAKDAADQATKEKEEEEKAAEDGKDDLWKANRPIHIFNEKERSRCTDRLKMSRLSKAEQKQLYGCVRFVHMAHEDLISLSTNEKYAICREYITEALSYKLNRYENALKDNLQYNNANYRVNHEPTAEELAWQDRSQGGQSNSLLMPPSHASTAGLAPPAQNPILTALQSAMIPNTQSPNQLPANQNRFSYKGPNAAYSLGPQAPPTGALGLGAPIRKQSPSRTKNLNPIGFKAMEMGDPNHPNPHLRMSMPESYYARKMEEEKVAQQNMSRKMIAKTLQEGIRKKFHDNKEQQQWEEQARAGNPGPYGSVV